MPKNVGTIDRGIRIAAALAIIVLLLLRQVSGVAAIILGVIAVVFLLTSMVSFCPLYFPFKVSTRKKT